MILPTDIQDAIVTQLRAIPELIALVGDPEAIQAYDDESQIHGTPDITSSDMLGVAVLVVWSGAEMPHQGETRGWTHNFRLSLKADSITNYYLLAQTIIDGVPQPPAGDGTCSFLNGVVHPGCDGIQDVQLTPETTDGVGRLSLSFSITER